MQRILRTFRSYLRMLMLVAVGTLFTACPKEVDVPSPTPPVGSGSGSTSSTTPAYADADAVLAAVRANSVQTTPVGPVDILIGVATGAFSNNGFSTFQNVGAVTCNGDALSLQSNNSYVYQPGATNPTGIDLTASNEVTWNVAGGSGFSPFQRTIAGPFPATGAITSSTTVVRANGYTLTATNVLNADSVIFLVGDVSKTLPGNASSCTFSASELSGVAAGSSVLQVSAYRSVTEDVDGKRIYFVKQSARTLSGTIQ